MYGILTTIKVLGSADVTVRTKAEEAFATSETCLNSKGSSLGQNLDYNKGGNRLLQEILTSRSRATSNSQYLEYRDRAEGDSGGLQCTKSKN